MPFHKNCRGLNEAVKDQIGQGEVLTIDASESFGLMCNTHQEGSVMVGTGVSSEGFIKALSDAYGGAIFLATRGVGADPATTLHVTGPGDAKRLTKACEHLVGGKITIRRHAPELLAKPHSMQSLVGVLVGEETIIADPTGAVTRAVQLVDMARRARAFMPKRVRGLYFNPARGVVFGWMREPPPAEEARSAMESAMAEAGAEWACVILSPVLPAVGQGGRGSARSRPPRASGDHGRRGGRAFRRDRHRGDGGHHAERPVVPGGVQGRRRHAARQELRFA
jgi:hypothetical protein